MDRTRNAAYGRLYPGFESQSLRKQSVERRGRLLRCPLCLFYGKRIHFDALRGEEEQEPIDVGTSPFGRSDSIAWQEGIVILRGKG